MIFRAYFNLLREARLSTTFFVTCTSRLGYAALPLCLLFTVRQATGSFAAGASTVSVFALCSLSMPVKARLVDQRTQYQVLPLLGVATAFALIAAGLLGRSGVTSMTAWMSVAALAGLVAPPLGPCMRAQWRRAVPNRIQTAYGLDSAAEETVWLLGPVAAGFAIATVPAWSALLAVPVFLLLGCIALGCSRFGRIRHAASRDTKATVDSAMILGRLAPVVGVMLVFGALTSLVVTGIAARADDLDRLELAGLAEASVGLGAVVGGLGVGLLPPARSWLRRIGLVLLGWGSAMAIGAFADFGFLAFTAFFAVGLFSAPVWVAAYNAADHLVAEGRRTEASTWVSTIANVGASMGTALTGAIIAAWGVAAGHWSAAALALVTAGVCLLAGALFNDGPRAHFRPEP